MAFDVGAVNQIVINATDDSGPAFNSAIANVQSLANAVGGAGLVLKTALSAAGIGTFVSAVAGAIQYQAELGNLAARAGTTAEALSQMRLAAADSGTTMDEVATMSERLSKALFEAQDGTTKAAQALQILGLDAKDLASLPTSQALEVLAQTLAGVKDGAAKTAVEMELLGRSGASAGAFLKELANQGLASISVTNEQAQAAQAAEAQFNKLADSSQQLKVALANELLPTINAVVGALAQISTSASLGDKATALLSADAQLLGTAWRNSLPAQILQTVANLAGAEQQAAQATQNWGGEANRARDSLKELNDQAATLQKLATQLGGVINAIESKDLGIGSGFAASFKTLTDAFNAGLISLQRYQELSNELLNQQPWAEKAAAAARQLAAEQQRVIDQQIQFLDSLHQQSAEMGMTVAETLRYEDAIHGTTGAIDQFIDERLRSIDASNQEKQALDDIAKGWAANDAAMKQVQDDTDRYNDSLLTLDQSLQLQLDTLGMSSTAAQTFALNQQLAAAAANDNETAVQRLTQAIQTLNQIATKQTELDAAKAQAQEWKDTANSIERDLESAFDSAFKKGQSFGQALRDALDNMFKTLVLRPILQPIAGSITNLLSGFGLGSPSNSTAFGNAGSLLSGSAGGGGIGDLIGGLFGGGAGASLGAGGAVAGAGSLLGTGGAIVGEGSLLAGGAAAGLASFVPIVGWAIAAYELLNAAGVFNKQPTPASGQFSITDLNTPSSHFEDSASTTDTKFGLQIGFADQGTSEFSGQAAQVFNQVVSGAIDAFATRFSPEQSAAFATTLKNMTFQAFSGTFTTEDFIQKYGGQILQQVVQAAFQELDPALAKAEAGFSGTADQVAQFTNTLLALYDATNGLPDAVKANIDSALDGTQDTATKVLAFAQVLGTLQGPLDGLHASFLKLSGTDIPALVDAMGGADAFTKGQAYLLDNFTTSAQKSALATQQLNDAFAQLGVATVPQTHQQFLDLLSGIDLTTDAGRQLYASLIALAPLFVEVHGTADQAAQSVDQLNTSIAGLNDAINPANQGLGDFNTSAQKTQFATTQLNQDFANLGVAVPQTHQQFLDLLSSIDRTTPAGEQLYESIFALGTLFVQVHGTADQAAQSLTAASNALTSVGQAAQTISEGDVSNSAQKFVQKFVGNIDNLLQNSSGDFGDNLGTKISLIFDEIAQLKAARDAYFATTGGVIDSTVDQYNEEIQQLQDLVSKGDTSTLSLSKQLADFTTYKAQYGAAIAEQLVNLEGWYRQQQNALKGNNDALAILAQEYQSKWQAIITGTASAASSTADSLDSVRKNILAFADSLLLGNLSPLSPTDQLAQAQQQYAQNLTAAQGGDQTALGDYQNFANALLQAERAVYGSSSQYTDAFQQVQRDARLLGSPTGNFTDVAVPGSATPGTPSTPAVVTATGGDQVATAQNQRDHTEWLKKLVDGLSTQGAANRQQIAQSSASNADEIVAAFNSFAKKKKTADTLR